MATFAPNYGTVTGLPQAQNIAPMIAALSGGASTALPTMPAHYGVGPAAVSSINQMLGDMGQIGGARLQTQYNLARTPISAQLGWQGELMKSQNMLENTRAAADQDAFMRQMMMSTQGYQAQQGRRASSILTQLLNPFLGSVMGGVSQ